MQCLNKYVMYTDVSNRFIISQLAYNCCEIE